MDIVRHVYNPADPRLGRHVVHDPRSRDYDLAAAVGSTPPTTSFDWHRDDRDVLDQGDVGSCTANAALGIMMTGPFARGTRYSEQDALRFYHDETVVDDIRGVYPPNDTGSSTLAAMKVLTQRKLVTGYQHAFAPGVVAAALAHGPLIIGVPFYESMFEPRNGQFVVDRRSQLDGGHEMAVDAWDAKGRRVRITNSWGLGWGDHGRAWLRFDDLAWLLAQQGDAAQPVVP